MDGADGRWIGYQTGQTAVDEDLQRQLFDAGTEVIGSMSNTLKMPDALARVDDFLEAHAR